MLYNVSYMFLYFTLFHMCACHATQVYQITNSIMNNNNSNNGNNNDITMVLIINILIIVVIILIINNRERTYTSAEHPAGNFTKPRMSILGKTT